MKRSDADIIGVALEILGRSVTKDLALHFQVDALMGVYFLFDGDALIYIGKAENVFARVAEHMRDKTFTSFRFIALDKCELDPVERALIRVFAPKLNRQGLSAPLRTITLSSSN